MRACDAVALIALAGCGGGRGAASGASAGGAPQLPSTAPERAPTVGDTALRLLPPGADLVFELDLSRARKNPLVGPVVDTWIDAADGAMEGRPLPLDAPKPPLSGAAWVVIAAYGVGTGRAATVTLVEPAPGMAIAGSTVIKAPIVALAPPAWIEKVRVAVAGGPSAADDGVLMALRARAMPARAEGAVLRGALRLSDDARIRLASALGVEPAPRAVSIWADVADDAALVMDLDAYDGADPEAPRRLGTALQRTLDKIGGNAVVRSLGLTPPIARTRVEGAQGSSWLHVVTVIPPGRLKWAVAQGRPQEPKK